LHHLCCVLWVALELALALMLWVAAGGMGRTEMALGRRRNWRGRAHFPARSRAYHGNGSFSDIDYDDGGVISRVREAEIRLLGGGGAVLAAAAAGAVASMGSKVWRRTGVVAVNISPARSRATAATASRSITTRRRVRVRRKR
jgi:hypothetical protein